jgi:hypothetical protein
MRAAANKPNINIVAINDPFISVDYMEYSKLPRTFVNAVCVLVTL